MYVSQRRTAALVAVGAVEASSRSALGLGGAAQAADGETPLSMVEDSSHPGAARIARIADDWKSVGAQDGQADLLGWCA